MIPGRSLRPSCGRHVREPRRVKVQEVKIRPEWSRPVSDKGNLSGAEGGRYRDVQRRVIQFYRLSYEQREAPTNIYSGRVCTLFAALSIPVSFAVSLPDPPLLSRYETDRKFCVFVLILNCCSLGHQRAVLLQRTIHIFFYYNKSLTFRLCYLYKFLDLSVSLYENCLINIFSVYLINGFVINEMALLLKQILLRSILP